MEQTQQKGRIILNTIRKEIIEKMESMELVFWQKNWPDGQVPPPLPYNGTSNNPYSGINILLLEKNEYKTDPRYYTFKQVQGIEKAHVKKGEHAKQIVFFKVKPEKEATENKTPGAYIEVYNVFNAQQIGGLEPYSRLENQEKIGHQRIVSLIEQLFKNDGLFNGNELSDFYSTSLKEEPDGATLLFDGYAMSRMLLHALSKINSNSQQNYFEDGIKLSTQESMRLGISLYFASRAFGVPFEIEETAEYYYETGKINTAWGEILKKDPKELTKAARDASKALNYLLNKEREYSKELERRGDLDDINKQPEEKQDKEIEHENIEQITSEKTLSELHITKIMEERRTNTGGFRISDADLETAKVAARAIINHENLMKGSMRNEGHEQAAIDAAKVSKNVLNNIKPSGLSFASELSHIRQEAGPGVEIKEAEVNKYYGPGQLKIYEQTAILTLSRSEKIAYDLKDLGGTYPAGAEIKVRGMKLLSNDRGVYVTAAEWGREENQR